MKTIILALGVLVSIAATSVIPALDGEGVFTYEIKVNLQRTIPPDHPEMKNMIPEFRTHKDQLVFNANESLYRNIDEEGEDEDIDNGGGMQLRLQRPQNEIYINRASSKRVMLQEFMGKKFLIEDTLKMAAWKLGSDTREIKGYLCKQATLFNEERKQNVVAWYTEQLRPFLGPENFNTLPGAVLHVDINDGERIITVSNLEWRALKKGELKIPSGGTKSTEANFRKMVNEHMQRVRANGGNVIIRN